MTKSQTDHGFDPLPCRSGFTPDTMGKRVGDKPRPTPMIIPFAGEYESFAIRPCTTACHRNSPC